MIPRRKANLYEGELQYVLEQCRLHGSGDREQIARFEAAVAAFLGVENTVALSSGRQGMSLIFKHMGIGPGDEVIVPAYTLAALMPWIEALGARPVPADVDLDTFSLSPDRVAARITERTKAIFVLHTFGMPARMPELCALAEAHGIPIVEDCAHAMGAALSGRPTGTFGHAAFCSLEINKPLNTFGGGIVIGRDGGLLDAIRADAAKNPPGLAGVLKNAQAVGTEERLFRSGLSFFPLMLLASPITRPLAKAAYSRLQHVPSVRCGYSALQATLGLKKLPELSQRIRKRGEIAQRMRDRLGTAATPQQLLPGATGAYQMFVVRLEQPAMPIRLKLLRNGIDAGAGTEIADACASMLGFDDCPNAETLVNNNLMLPFYDGMSETESNRVIDCLLNIL